MRLLQTLILKGGISACPYEASNLNHVVEMGEETGLRSIPVPKVHRVLNVESESFYRCKCPIVMFNDGRSVEACWDDESDRACGRCLQGRFNGHYPAVYSTTPAVAWSSRL